MRAIFFLLGCVGFLMGASLSRDGSSEVVTDRENKLVWQDNSAVIEVQLSQPEAMEYCKNLRLEGRNTWRLPTPEEFTTIVDKKNTLNYIAKAFKYNAPDGYWSDYVHWRTLWFYADYMHFISGTLYYDNKLKKKYVRCVRDF